jgi:hypothetical protein
VAPWLPETDRQKATVIGAIEAATARYSEGGYVVVDDIVRPWFVAVPAGPRVRRRHLPLRGATPLAGDHPSARPDGSPLFNATRVKVAWQDQRERLRVAPSTFGEQALGPPAGPHDS